MGKPLVSIITPTYRRLKCLKEAIACVQHQSYPYWEHLIIADGHDLRVKKWVRSLRDPRVKYLHTSQTNDVGGSQRNYGLRKAKGAVLAYLDDDNLIHPNYLKEMVKRFRSKKVGYVICYVNHHLGWRLMPKLPFKFSHIDTLNFMVRKKVVQKVGGWDGRRGQDFRLIDKVSKVSKGVFVKRFLGHHRAIKWAWWERMEEFISFYLSKLL